eukprot:scaffold4359_cov106-Isochrysis_galbana.AAC.2
MRPPPPRALYCTFIAASRIAAARELCAEGVRRCAHPHRAPTERRCRSSNLHWAREQLRGESWSLHIEPPCRCAVSAHPFVERSPAFGWPCEMKDGLKIALRPGARRWCSAIP